MGDCQKNRLSATFDLRKLEVFANVRGVGCVLCVTVIVAELSVRMRPLEQTSSQEISKLCKSLVYKVCLKKKNIIVHKISREENPTDALASADLVKIRAPL